MDVELEKNRIRSRIQFEPTALSRQRALDFAAAADLCRTTLHASTR